MEINILNCLIIIAATLVASAFFSGMEIAFLASNKLKLELDKKQSSLFNFVANRFSAHSSEYITTILIGNNIALVVYSLQMSSLIGYFIHNSGSIAPASLLIETVISTIIIIFIAEFIPKVTVKSNPNFYYRYLSPICYIFYLLFFPISKTITWISGALMRLFGIRGGKAHIYNQFDKGDLVHLVNDIAETEIINENDKDIKIFQNALDFSDLRVRDCMIQRIEIEGVDIGSTVKDLKELFIETKFSRVVVYKDTVDNIIGYVNNKDLFKNPTTISDMLLKILFVPETMPAQKLLAMFIKNNSSIAAVIDEFGGTAGMITLEDILEEIFGEIEDEHDSSNMIEKKISDVEYIFSGRLEVDYLNEKYNLQIDENEDYDTLAGYLIFMNEDIPKQGEEFMFDNKQFKVVKINGSRIELIKVILSQ